MIANGETVLCQRAMRRKREHAEKVKTGVEFPLRRRIPSLPVASLRSVVLLQSPVYARQMPPGRDSPHPVSAGMAATLGCV